jgi:hypothetical protein
MNIEYGPVGKRVIDNDVFARRQKEYDPCSRDFSDLLEETVERIDNMMTDSRYGCSLGADEQAHHHRYERSFKVPLYTGTEARQVTGLSFLHINNHRPVRHVTEQYFVTATQHDTDGRRLLGTSYIFTRYIHQRLATQVQYSLDLPDWITHPDGGPETLWNDAVPYDIEQLGGALFELERLQRYEDEVAEWDQVRGIAPLKLNA